MARVRVQIRPEPVESIDSSQPTVIDGYSQNFSEADTDQALPVSQATTMPSQGIFISRTKAIWTAVIVLLVVGLLVAYQNRETSSGPSGTLGTSQELPGATAEAQQYYNEISPFVELPAGEAPTVLNVSDAEAVKKDNAALTDIKNGDKMLFFTKSRKLVVYRPGTKKVVAVVSLATPAASPTTTR